MNRVSIIVLSMLRRRLASKFVSCQWTHARLRSIICLVVLASFMAPTDTVATLNRNSPASSEAFTQRQVRMLETQIARPFPNTDCTENGPPGNQCLWGQINLAISLLFLDSPAEDVRAGRILRDAAAAIPDRVGWRRLANPRQPETSARVDAGLDFPFLTATLLRRAVGLFGATQLSIVHRLAPETEHAIHELFWRWVGAECRLSDANLDMIWRPWGSENHDLQRVHTCWAGADLLVTDGDFAGRFYNDGSTPAAQRAAWTTYLKAFIRSRATSGLAVEFFSPVYSKYFLNILYNFLDFSEDLELRRLSENAVTLWWAMWAQEQIGGVHGGSKTRFYFDGMGAGTPVDNLVWLYFGIGHQPATATHPATFPMLTSRYRIPSTVEAIVLGRDGRGTHEIWSRHAGLAAGPMLEERYSLSPDLTAITRYTFSTSGYVMGSAIIPRLPAARWAAISSQNRWNGVVLSDGPDARVYATPTPQGGRSHYNAVLAAQSHGAQIVQRLPSPLSRGAGDMAIHVGPRLRRVEREGWIFVEGSAFVAVRPAFGGYTADGEQPSVFHLQDQRSPVVVQAGTRADHTSFEAFQAAVLTAPLRANLEEVSFQGLDGAGHLHFFLDSDRRPEVDRKPIDAPAGWVLHSAFVRQAIGSGTVEIGAGGQTMQLRFE